MALHRTKRHSDTDPVFGSSALAHAAATKLFPEAEQSAREVYQLVHDELYLDGNARQNLSARPGRRMKFTSSWTCPSTRT